MRWQGSEIQKCRNTEYKIGYKLRLQGSKIQKYRITRKTLQIEMARIRNTRNTEIQEMLQIKMVRSVEKEIPPQTVSWWKLHWNLCICRKFVSFCEGLMTQGGFLPFFTIVSDWWNKEVWINGCVQGASRLPENNELFLWRAVLANQARLSIDSLIGRLLYSTTSLALVLHYLCTSLALVLRYSWLDAY